MDENPLMEAYDELREQPYRVLLLYLIQMAGTDPLGTSLNQLGSLSTLMFIGGPSVIVTDELKAQSSLFLQGPARHWYDEMVPLVGQDGFCYQRTVSEAMHEISEVLVQNPATVGLSERQVSRIIDRDGEEVARKGLFFFFTILLAQQLFLTARHEFRAQYGVKRALFRNKWSLA